MDNLDLKIADRYRLLRKLGEGGFGFVYEGIDLRTGTKVAIKLEEVRIEPSILAEEVDVYQGLPKAPGILHVFWHGTECDYNAAVIDLLGPSLEDLFNYCGRQFSLKTVLLLADQLIARLHFLHARNILHRDIKPENFLMGRGRSGNTVYITDFGLALDQVRRSHTTGSLVGTARYASVNGHVGAKQTEYDDLTSLGYMLVYFLKGSLPWQGIRVADQEEKERMILRQKQNIQLQELCEGLPGCFIEYFRLLHSSEKEDKPTFSIQTSDSPQKRRHVEQLAGQCAILVTAEDFFSQQLWQDTDYAKIRRQIYVARLKRQSADERATELENEIQRLRIENQHLHQQLHRSSAKFHAVVENSL